MSFSLKFGRSAGAERRRIALEQVDRALAELDNSALNLDERVHQYRKRCKKLRALARLFRSSNPDQYRAINVALRDSARRVSVLRDAGAALATHEALFEPVNGDQMPAALMEALRYDLQANWDCHAGQAAATDLLCGLRAELAAVREGIVGWPDTGPGKKSVCRGLAQTYRGAYDAWQAAKRDPSVETWHAWRKQVKYLRYQLKIVRRLWSAPLDSWRRELDGLGDLIGLDHDLACLQRLTAGPGKGSLTTGELHQLAAHCQTRSVALRRDALKAGRKIFQDDPAAFSRALKALSRAT